MCNGIKWLNLSLPLVRVNAIHGVVNTENCGLGLVDVLLCLLSQSKQAKLILEARLTPANLINKWIQLLSQNVRNKLKCRSPKPRLTLSRGGQQQKRDARQLMQPIKLPLPPHHPSSSLCKHFKVLPSADGNKANEPAVNGLRCWGCRDAGDPSNDAHHTGGGGRKRRLCVAGARWPPDASRAGATWSPEERRGHRESTTANSLNGHFCWWETGRIGMFVSVRKGESTSSPLCVTMS